MWMSESVELQALSAIDVMGSSHPSGCVELEEPREDVEVDEEEDGHDEHPRLQVVPRPHERVAH